MSRKSDALGTGAIALSPLVDILPVRRPEFLDGMRTDGASPRRKTGTLGGGGEAGVEEQ